MNMKAIQIRFLGANNFTGCADEVWTEGNNSITLPLEYEVSTDELRARLMSEELLIRVNWSKWVATLGDV